MNKHPHNTFRQVAVRVMRTVATTPLCLGVLYALLCISVDSCTIEPPLHLADDTPDVKVVMGEVITDINVIWDIDADWYNDWWYGWDDDDRTLWGEIGYPEPEKYEGRFYYFGETPASVWTSLDKLTVLESPFRRRFDFGYHNMLLWSHAISYDGTQALIIDEDDPDNIHATTSTSRMGYPLPPRSAIARNNPEIFYSGLFEKLHISRDTLDYDYYDALRRTWVKEIRADLYPLVYIYLVQVVIYNNNGRITGINDNAAISSMADGVHVHTGHTSNSPTTVAYAMRLKRGLPARNGKRADIFGGKFTTFGLCDMESWARSRASTTYSGSRSDLRNHLMLNLTFSNTSDSLYTFEITPQLQRQAHGGLVTIEIDADTLQIPHAGYRYSSGFDPTIAPRDSIEHVFDL